MMIGGDPDRGGLTPQSALSDSSDIVGTPGVIPFTWEEEPGRPKGPGEKIFESVLSRDFDRRESLQGSSSNWPREIVEQTDELETSGTDESSPDAHIMKLNLRASLMGVHILDDETEMFFSRQVSNASSNNFQTGGTVPFTWEVEPGQPVQPAAWPEPSMGPLTPPPGSRPVSGLLYHGQFANRPASGLLYYGPQSGSRPPSGAHYSGQLDLGPDTQFGNGMQFSERLFKKLVGQSRAATTTNSIMQYDGVAVSKSKRRGESSTETLDRHFGHYSSDIRYDQDNDSVSPTSTLDHHETESFPSSESERFYPSRNPNLTRYLDSHTPRGRHSSQDTSTSASRPSSQLAQCLLSLTAMADDTTDEDDIIFEQPSTTAPLWQPQVQPQVQPAEPPMDWPIVQYQGPSTKPQHKHPKTGSSPKSGRTIERWSSNSSSWNLSLVSKPKSTVTKVSVSGSKKSRRHSSGKTNGVTLREIHTGASSSTAPTYDRSGDVHGRHKWERDSSGSLPSVEELGFEAYDRPGEVSCFPA